MMIQWWYWIILGCALCVAELAVPALILVWLGVAGLLTGLLVWLIPLGVTAQLLCWGVLSVVLTLVFLKYFRPGPGDRMVGRADEALNEVGILTRRVEPWNRGEILFQKPILGSDRWACTAESAIAEGERVRVVAVEGSALRVVRG